MKRLLPLLLLLLTALQGFSQTKGISYQAVILSPEAQEIPGVNAQGNILANSTVSIQFTIVNAVGIEEYQEYQTTNTDKYGMINLLIGTGIITSSNDFTDIFWDGNTKKLKVGIDFSGGGNFSPLSEQNLSYMPQPTTLETTQLIMDNAASILAEQVRAEAAEQTNALAISLNTAKTGITPAQAIILSNTSGTNTGDQDISGIATNASAIIAIETEQGVQNTAIALNTAKTGTLTPAQTTILSNTSGTNTGDQDISGIATNASAITAIETVQGTQNTAIALNTAKTGITPAQTTILSNTSGTNTGDQNISGIATNASAITAIETEQGTQNTAIALNTAKTGITPAQTIILSNTSGTNTGDQNISGIATNASAITAIETEQGTQNTAIALNTVKVGITTAQANEITANTVKVGITPAQTTILSNTSGTNTGDQNISGIATNASAITAIETEQGAQNTAIALNTAKTGITPAQANEITANTAKVGITPAQTTILSNTSGTNTGDQDISGIATNASAITAIETEQGTQNTAIALNTAKTGITPAQTTILSNTSGTNTGDQNISGIATNASAITAIETEQGTQNTAIALNTAKTGITPAQTIILSNTSGTNTGDQNISGIATNASAITAIETEQGTQNTAIALNTVKVGITTAQANEITANTVKVGITPAQTTILSNTSGTNTGDQNISGIATNASAITAIETEQGAQNTAIALNTAKTGITPAQANEITANTAKVGITPAQTTILSNTSGTNTGDQNISGIATNASAITVIETEQGTQNTAIALNTAKTGITPAQATILSNTSGTNTGDQNISGIATNASAITAIETEQGTQNTAIALNTAKTGITTAQANEITANTVKVGITPAQATILSNTSGTNTGDQNISGIATNASAITAIETEQGTQNTAIALNTAKTGITTAQANEITANTAKVGITPAQTTILSNTSGTNTGDQNISGIATNASAITAIETEQGTQNTAIALNTAKVTNATHTGDVTGDTALTISNDAVTIAKIGTSGATDANKTLTTDSSGNPQWTVSVSSLEYGDIKQGIQTADHNGWVLLNGRALATLTTSQLAQATTLGLSGNLPNANNAYLSQNGSTLGSVSGSNSKTIAQDNLPNVILSGTTSIAGVHTHSIDRKSNPDTVAYDPLGTFANTNTAITSDRATIGTFDVASSGSHNHTLTTSSINGGVSQQNIDITPNTLSVNVFIYLGQ